MKFTGERVLFDDPEIGWLAQRHLFAYQQALGYVKAGWRILDCGCGEGYGTGQLAGTGAQVIGIDVSQEAINLAQTKYSSPRLSFGQADALFLPFASNVFDLVCAFQVIEHLTNYEVFFEEIWRVLARGGIFIITTLNKLIYSPNSSRPCSPFHVYEFVPEELKDILKHYFVEVKFLGIFASQRYLDVENPRKGLMRRVDEAVERFPRFCRRLVPRVLKVGILPHLVRRANASINGDKYSISQRDFWLGSEDFQSAIDLFAICRK